jgi:DNA-binding beta-propeller fold protein YncE
MTQMHTSLLSLLTRVILIVITLGLILWARPAMAATTIEMAGGVAGGTGIASDPANANVYYVEFNGGTLKRIHIIAGCDLPPGPATCPITTVASGFTHPEDVALDLDHGLAYVTTRDDLGTTGALWRVDLVGGARSLVTFNLGAPQQISLDIPTNTAYVIGFDAGKLWKIDLTTGAKVAVMTGLGNPVGLAVTADRTRAYVTEQMPPRLAEIDLALHTRIRNVVTGLTSPFYLSWTDPAQYALYLVQRDPANDVLRVDLPSSTATPVITGLPVRPSGITVNLLAGVAFVATDAKVEKVGLAELPMGEPVFLGVGNVPSTKIVDGYATTDPGYFFQVKDSPFGGTLNILGNLSNFKALGATHYRVNVSYEGSVPTPLALSWNTYHWNTVTSQFDLTPVSPVPGPDQVYQIPSDYPTHAERWFPSFLMMRWPSGSSGNGHYTFTVELFKPKGPGFVAVPTPPNSLTVLVDNSSFNVDVVHLFQHGIAAPIPVCAIVSPPAFPSVSTFDVEVSAYDPNQHLLSYSVTALWGHSASEPVFSDSYAFHVNAEGPHLWSGVVNHLVPPNGWQAHCNCAHTFYLDAWKRTIDGYNYLINGTAHQSITIDITSGPGKLPACL